MLIEHFFFLTICSSGYVMISVTSPLTAIISSDRSARPLCTGFRTGCRMIIRSIVVITTLFYFHRVFSIVHTCSGVRVVKETSLFINFPVGFLSGVGFASVLKSLV